MPEVRRSPFGDEAKSTGTAPPIPERVSPFGDPAKPTKPAPDQTSDLLWSIAQGLREAVEGAPAAPQDLINLAGRGVGWATGTEQNWDVPLLPSSDDINQFTSKIAPNYEPQTRAGRWGRTLSSFAPVGPGSWAGGARKVGTELLSSLGGGAASEYAGEQMAGSDYEELARLLGGLGGGAAGKGIEQGIEGSVTQPARQAEARTEDAARQHGVNLTKGERTGDVSQQIAEQQMLHGARGELAQRLMAGRRQENLSAIKDAGAGIIDQAAPTRGQTPVASGGQLNDQTRGRAEGLMDTGGQAIQGAINEGVIVDAQRLRNLPGDLDATLTGIDPYIPDVVIDSNTPMAAKAKAQIDKFVTKFNDPALIDESLDSVERLRRTIGKMQGVTPEDKRAMGKLMSAFDDWYDDTINNDATVAPTPPGMPSGKTPDQILAELKAGRATFKQGADIARPRGKPAGGKQVAQIASEGALPEETARLLAPNDAGNLSTTAIKTIDRLVEVGADAADLDQVRHIVLQGIMGPADKGADPGKVVTRVNNFLANNPTAAAKLFTADQVQAMKDWAATNQKLVVKKEALNPSHTSYGTIKEIASEGVKGAIGNTTLIGAVLGGAPAAVVGGGIGGYTAAVSAASKAKAAKEALKPADRRTVSQYALYGAGKGAQKAAKGAIQAGNTVTVEDPAFESTGEQIPAGKYDGQRGKVIESVKGGRQYRVRMSDGNVVTIGETLLRGAD
jgi:outer membrane lipoprotein SlyB